MSGSWMTIIEMGVASTVLRTGEFLLMLKMPGKFVSGNMKRTYMKDTD